MDKLGYVDRKPAIGGIPCTVHCLTTDHAFNWDRALVGGTGLVSTTSQTLLYATKLREITRGESVLSHELLFTILTFTSAAALTSWTRIGLGLKFVYLTSLTNEYIERILKFLIKHTLSQSFPRTHASMAALARRGKLSDNVCLTRNCTVPI